MLRLLLVVFILACVPIAHNAQEGKTVKVKRVTPVLAVEKIEPVVAFWSALGFEKKFDVKDGDVLGFAAFGKGDVEIMYQTFSSLKKDAPAAAQANGPTLLYIEVDDLNSIERALPKEAVFLPRRKTFYGADEIGFREPGGHLILFAQFAAQAAE